MSTLRIAALFGVGILLSSCSVYMTASQPGRKDLAVLNEGMRQATVQAELEQPAWSGKDGQGFDIEVFQFVQGYSGGARTARVLWHPAADTFSLGLWEAIGTHNELCYSLSNTIPCSIIGYGQLRHDLAVTVRCVRVTYMAESLCCGFSQGGVTKAAIQTRVISWIPARRLPRISRSSCSRTRIPGDTMPVIG